ncbi:MAG: hypothetical protein DHS20C18_04450 [Saprospiraceae bacterium]|nr:MAG: hypothetical protein DHS20C18_04450 [Saprospiraceae bacterium]
MKTIYLIAITLGMLLAIVLGNIEAPQKAEITGTGYVPKKVPKMERVQRRFEQEYLMTRVPKTGEVPKERLLQAFQVAEEKRMQKSGDALPIYWEERGPTNVGGRTRAIVIDANDADGSTVWAGSVSGGLWKTTNIDAANPVWNKIDDLFDNLAISAMAQDPSDPNIMYFGTGEGWGNIDGVFGIGIWKTIDGGDTWNLLPTATGGVFRLVRKIVIAADGTVFICTPQGGVMRSEDGGLTWPKVLGTFVGISPGVGTAHDSANDIEIAANGDLYAGFSAIGVYKSTDNGDSWTQVNTGLPTMNYGRLELACAPSNANFVYVMFQDTTTANKDKVLGIWRTTNGGTGWTQRVATPAFGGQTWYNQILAVDPADTERVWAGAVSMNLSTDGGNSWNGVGGIHSDHHMILFEPGSSDEIIFGNDGGVYKSSNGSAANPSIADKNSSYNVTQFYAVAVHPDAGSNYMLGGTQDNATPKFTNPGLSTTSCVLCCCDGGWTFIDQDDPSIQVASTQDGSFNVSTDGGGSFGNIVPGNSKRLFITPGDYDDAEDILYVSDTTASFIRVSDVGGTNTLTTEFSPIMGKGLVSAMKVSPNTSNRVFMGMTDGGVFIVDDADQDGAITVTDINGPVVAYVSSIAVEDGDDGHIAITYSNYGVNSVWESIDTGATWVSIEGDLPDMPIRWIMFNPLDADQALVATELGVWSTGDLDGTSTNWFPTNNFGLANVRVDMLEYRNSDFLVAAATHGRGMYTTDYFSLLASCPEFLDLSGVVSPGIYVASEYITSNGTIQSGSKVIYHAGEYIELTDGFSADAGSDFWALILGCTPAPMPIAEEDPEEKIFVENKPLAQGPLLKCYPSPMSHQATIEYHLDTSERVQLTVFDVTGKPVKTLVNQPQQEAGIHRVKFDAGNLDSGFYLIHLRTNHSALTEKVMVVR